MKTWGIFLTATILSMGLIGCSGAPQKTAMANPASVYCEKQGGRLELKKDEEGNIAGYCHFNDGSVCEEWAFYRGECPPDNRRN